MSANSQKSGNLPELRTGPLVTGASLAGAGLMLVLAGLAVGGTHLIAATRRWIQEMEVPPSEQARMKWEQAKIAAAAGTAAWQNGTPAKAASSS